MSATGWIVLGVMLIVLATAVLVISGVFLHSWNQKFKNEE